MSRNYPTHDLEVEAIIHALKMQREYPLGRKFVLMSDHGGFRYLFDQLNLNARKVSWLAMMSEFEFEMRYVKGKKRCS